MPFSVAVLLSTRPPDRALTEKPAAGGGGGGGADPAALEGSQKKAAKLEGELKDLQMRFDDLKKAASRRGEGTRTLLPLASCVDHSQSTRTVA